MNKKRRRTALLLLCAAASSAAGAVEGLTPEQKLRADGLISVFENGTPEIQYGYVEKLGDGRGYTVGRGFTTGTGDAYAVVLLYRKRVPGTPLASYLDALKALAEERSDRTDGLDGFPAAWKNAASDSAFRAAQDELNDSENYAPAMDAAGRVGLRTALARVALYDAAVVHGTGQDADGMPALVTRATEAAGGTPLSGTDEKAWLRAFLQARKADMLDPSDRATQKVWAESAYRCDRFMELLDAGNLDFHGPLQIRRRSASAPIP